MANIPDPYGTGTSGAGSSMIPKGVIGSLLAYAEARGVLLSIEAQEALQQLVRIVLFTVVGAIAAFTGWLFLNGVLIGLLVEELDWSIIASAAAVMGGNLLVAALSLLLAKRCISSSRWFSDTLNELKKDRAWLAKQTE